MKVWQVTCFGVRLGGLDADVQCSNAILGKQLLTMSGAIGMEQRLMWRFMSNNLGDLKKLSRNPPRRTCSVASSKNARHIKIVHYR